MRPSEVKKWGLRRLAKVCSSKESIVGHLVFITELQLYQLQGVDPLGLESHCSAHQRLPLDIPRPKLPL